MVSSLSASIVPRKWGNQTRRDPAEEREAPKQRTADGKHGGYTDV